MSWKGKIELTFFDATTSVMICSILPCMKRAKWYTRIPGTTLDFLTENSSLKDSMPIFCFCEEHTELLKKLSVEQSFMCGKDGLVIRRIKNEDNWSFRQNQTMA